MNQSQREGAVVSHISRETSEMWHPGLRTRRPSLRESDMEKRSAAPTVLMILVPSTASPSELRENLWIRAWGTHHFIQEVLT